MRNLKIEDKNIITVIKATIEDIEGLSNAIIEYLRSEAQFLETTSIPLRILENLADNYDLDDDGENILPELKDLVVLMKSKNIDILIIPDEWDF